MSSKIILQHMPQFMGAFNDVKQLPPEGPPEIALIGRSNVGKSSFINALTQHKHLARTSKTPGRTLSLVFFNFQDKLRIVDCPGYGYANIPLTVKREINQLCLDYFTQRRALRLALLLIDLRHGIKPLDEEMIDIFTKTGTPFCLIGTKSDQVKPETLLTNVAKLRHTLSHYPTAHRELFITSAFKKIGFDDIYRFLDTKD